MLSLDFESIELSAHNKRASLYTMYKDDESKERKSIERRQVLPRYTECFSSFAEIIKKQTVGSRIREAVIPQVSLLLFLGRCVNWFLNALPPSQQLDDGPPAHKISETVAHTTMQIKISIAAV
ncbi:hypothetical protein GJ496_001920 [Pomphorhynchus laevis]|nr:hypothetical protein GJ496_001920 [Pomphorhynchus laevis]